MRPYAHMTILLACACLALDVGFPAHAVTLDELVLLNGIPVERGAAAASPPGAVSTSTATLSPDNTLGFSVRAEWTPDTAVPPDWPIRFPLAERPAGLDTLVFDLLIGSAQDGARLQVYLDETDGDRWQAADIDLGALNTGQWVHYELERDAMTAVPDGNGAPQWERVCEAVFEFGGPGDANVFLDAARLTGPGGATQPVFRVDDDGYPTDPAWSETVRVPQESARVYLPFDESQLSHEDYMASAKQWAALFGGAACIPMAGFSVDVPDKAADLRAGGIPTMHRTPFALGYMRYLTRREAWDVNADGASLNERSCGTVDWDCPHTFAIADAGAAAAFEHKADALLAAGVGVWSVAGYTYPWWDTLWGYAPAMREAYRENLLGTDDGLRVQDGGASTTLRFMDYFHAYTGFRPQPADLGLASWSEYEPPPPAQWGPVTLTLFFFLRSYEWLKLADHMGGYMADGGGERLWVIPNPEDIGGSSDYVYMLRSEGVGNLFPQWFGPIGIAAEAGYASLPYLREQADRGGARLSIAQETGVGGHDAPYLDWRLAFNGVYALTAAGGLDGIESGFVDDAPYDYMADPANPEAFARFRDNVGKAEAFLHARAEQPQRPDAEILCISERSPAKAAQSFFFGLNQPHSLALGLARAHLVFDLRDAVGLAGVLDRYRVVVYTPSAPRVGDFAVLADWLQAAPDRVLVTHSFVPTRDASEWWTFDDGTGLGEVPGGALLGLGTISATTSTRCTVNTVGADLAGIVAVDETFEFPSPITATTAGETLIDTDAGPLVTRASVGGSDVIYLNYTPTTEAFDPGVAGNVVRLDARILGALAGTGGIAALCDTDYDAAVQVFDVAGGRSVLVWDSPALENWDWRYETGLDPLAYEAPGVAHTLSVPAAAKSPWIVYDFWNNRSRTVEPVGGALTLNLEDAVTGLYYVGLDTPEFQSTVADAQALHTRFRSLGIEEGGEGEGRARARARVKARARAKAEGARVAERGRGRVATYCSCCSLPHVWCLRGVQLQNSSESPDSSAVARAASSAPLIPKT
ncbi:MAG: hypothetical protein GWP08_08280 [Nitrospiraceae bacterium]|nr:hypothetical protein [Nitrospiraceae bacterium]